MRKLIVLVVLFAVVPAFDPAPGEALTLSQRVAKLESKLSCLRRVPVAQYDDVAAYGNPVSGLNARTPTTRNRRQRAPRTTTRTD
jgi:hypothetical protein